MCDPALYRDWVFYHNGHPVTMKFHPNRYEAADEFRNLYGYYPDLNLVTSHQSH